MEKQNNPVIKKELVILGVGAVFVVFVSIVYILTRPTLVNRSLSQNTVTSTSTTTVQNLQRTYCDIPSEGFPKTFGKYDYAVSTMNSAAKYSDLVNSYNTADNTSNPIVIPLGSRATAVGLWDNISQPSTDVLGIVWANCKYDLDLATLDISSARLGEMYINNKQQLFFLQYDDRRIGVYGAKEGEDKGPDLVVTAYKIDLKTKSIISKNIVPFSYEIRKYPGSGDTPRYLIDESNLFDPSTSRVFLSVGYFDGCYGYPSCVNISGYTEKMFETADKNIGAYEYNFETNKLERKVATKHFNKTDNSIFIKDIFEIGGDESLYVKEQRETLKKF